MRILIVAVVVALAAGFIAESASSDASIPSVRTCREARSAPPRTEHLKRPPQTVRPDEHLVAVVRTSCGRFTIGLDARRSPVIVNSFVHLARAGFYDGLSFYRVVPDFVIQSGDPTETGGRSATSARRAKSRAGPW